MEHMSEYIQLFVYWCQAKNMLHCALNVIWWHQDGHYGVQQGLNAIGMKNLPFQVMQECSMARYSLGCQSGFRTSGSFVHPSLDQPFIICCMRNWSVVSSLVAFWIVLTCALDIVGVSLWMVTSNPLICNFLMWTDSAECICHRYLRTWNVLYGEIIGLNFQLYSL